MLVHHPGRVRSTVLTLIAALVLVTGCESATSGTEATTAAETPATSSSAAPPPPGTGPREDEAPPPDASFPASTAEDRGEGAEGESVDTPGEMRVIGLRLTAHEGFERLVVDLDSSGAPPWVARYTEPTDPDGRPIAIPGNAFLRLSLFTQADDLPASGISVDGTTGSVVEARTTGVAAGNEDVLVALRGGAAPFRAFTLTDPGRLVVDIRPPA